MKPIGLYIHVPFCESKCPYCDFYSVKCDKELIDRYTKATCEALKRYSQEMSLAFDTIYFGGGTPSLLGNENIEKILKTVNENFSFCAKEVTLEVNPTTASTLDFKRLLSAGVNRLSIGVQSAVDEELKQLGRRHTVRDAERTIKMAQEGGFENISVDLMVAVPSQTKRSLLKSIDFCANQNIQHISAYLLKIEENTPFYVQQTQLALKDDDEQAELYLHLVDELEKHGFKQYEISNFAREGYQGQHNLKYWNAEEYLGIGPSAHSFVNGKRLFYPRSLQDFLSGENEFIYDGDGGSVEEYLMLKLRLREGVNNNAFKERLGFDIPQVYFERAKTYQKYGLIEVDEKSFRLTKKGLLMSNALISNILVSEPLASAKT